MNTKQKILNEALTLFSEKGYTSVYVGDIADAVGIKAPSLYKHYKNKQEIFDSCIKVFSERIEDVMSCLRLTDASKVATNCQAVNTETFIEIANSLFMFYWQDDVANKFRKMLMIERYHDPELNELFEDLFINGAIRHGETMFSDLMQAKIIKKENPYIIALRFYTPIFYLLQKYDMHHDMIEEANVELTIMVQEFCNTYGIEKH